MELSISRMEDVCNDKVILFTDLHHCGQTRGKLCSGNSAIADQIIRPKPGNGAKSSLSTCPELCPLCLSFCGLDLTGIIFLADFYDPFGQSLHSVLEPIELDQQDSLSIKGKTRMDRFLDRLDG